MSARTFSESKRQNIPRSRKPILLLLVEGKFNATETKYFDIFRKNSKYRVRVITTGDTDPAGMVEALNRECLKHDINAKNGDKAFVVLDLDVDQNKAAIIRQMPENDRERIIISNPCFELWYINHFEYSTKQFVSSKQVKEYLKNRYVPDYKESKSMKDILASKLDVAIKNSKQQIATGQKNGYTWPSENFNPRTDVGYLVEIIIGKED